MDTDTAESIERLVKEIDYLAAQAHAHMRYELHSLPALTSSAQASKQVADCRLGDILESYVLRSVFRQYLVHEKTSHFLLAFEELSYVLTIPCVTLRKRLLLKFWARYLYESAAHYIAEVAGNLAKKEKFEEIFAIEEDQPSATFTKLLESLKKLLEAQIPGYTTSKFGFYHANYLKHTNKTLTTKEYETLLKLGEGGFGKVHAIKRSSTGALYAVKEMSILQIIKKKRMDTVVNEARILRGNEHPFLLNLHHCFADKLKIYLVVDLMTGGELKFHLSRAVKPEKEVAQFWLASLILGIEWLHKKDIIHRDLKPANVLLDKHGYIKIADFGLSLDLSLHKHPPSSYCGTPGYIAPEMYLGPSWDRRYQLTSRRSTTERRSTSQNSTKFYSKTRSKLIPQDIMMSYVSRSMKQDSSPKQPNSKVMEAKSNEAEGDFKFPRYRNYGKAVDWYSFGVISHQLYCFGTFPFTRGPERTEKHLIQENIAGNIRWRDLRAPYNGKENKFLSDMTKDLITKLLHHSPTERLGGKEGASEIKAHPFFEGLEWEKLGKKLVVPPFQPKPHSVNAEFQDRGEEVNEKKMKKELKKLISEETVNTIEALTYTRPDTLIEELLGAEIVCGSQSQRKTGKARSKCVIT